MPAMLLDAYDQPVSTTSAEAVEHYVRGIECSLMRNAGAVEAFTAAIAADENFALAHAALTVPLQLYGKPEEARAEASRARELAAGITEREKRHVEALATAAAGDVAKALDLIQEQVREFPRDAFLLNRNNFLLNASGRQRRKEESLALFDGCAVHYGDDAWFLGAYSFSQNEMYQFDEAWRLADKSYALNPRNSSCSHSMAHVMFETGDHVSGAAFLDGWLDGSLWQAEMAGHLNWHLALGELGRGRQDAAVKLYENVLRPGKYPSPALQGALVDSTSLLWRCEILGIEPPADADREVAEFAAARFPRAGQSFPDVHKAFAYALAGNSQALGTLLSETCDLNDAGKLAAGPVVPAIVEAVWAFAEGRYEDAVTSLAPLAGEIGRIGGSRAQYEVVQDTLIAAYVRAGQIEKAEPMLRERLNRRPSARDEAWLSQTAATPAPLQESV
jgi:tetratricopeptide (TPR) repeat protein